jgi:hypothetical protein
MANTPQRTRSGLVKERRSAPATFSLGNPAPPPKPAVRRPRRSWAQRRARLALLDAGATWLPK